jgi:signal transduction histidine kinase
MTSHDRHVNLIATQLSLSAVISLVVTILWGLTGMGYFWPRWVYFGLAAPLAFEIGLPRAWAEPRGPARRLAVHAMVSWILAGLSLVIWALSGGGFFWPAFEILGLAVAYVLHARWGFDPKGDLAVRVAELSRTRRGALDVQAAELRRIERDLHDGAQARLVALSMQLGRAEERLADQPDAAGLVRSAREQATAAIGELRDLARGIAPPVLADRGLVAAVEALADRSHPHVDVSAKLRDRLAPVVESAAYFVVAESLTNVAKHAPGANVEVVIARAGPSLQVVIADDGPGGAVPTGNGLTGLRQRVEALDGSLTVTSPPGDGTTVTAVLPCG